MRDRLMSLLLLVGFAAFAFFVFSIAKASARDNGQWATDSDITKWYMALRQPDEPTRSCCGEADAYWADSFEISEGRYLAIITDDRPDSPLRRRPVALGTRIVIPNHKIKFDQGNPTGHGIVFLSTADVVLCYLPPGGV